MGLLGENKDIERECEALQLSIIEPEETSTGDFGIMYDDEILYYGQDEEGVDKARTDIALYKREVATELLTVRDVVRISQYEAG